MQRSLLPQFALAVFALSFAGCQCHKNGGPSDSFAEIDVIWTDVDGTMHSDRNATYDFGQAFIGDKIAKQMKVRNGGLSTLTLDSLVWASGQDVTIGSLVKDDAYFEVKFNPTVTIEPSEDVSFDMFFTPKAGYKNPLSVLTLTGEGTRPEDSTATITLKGQGQGGTCDLPDVIDFGLVPLNDHLSKGWTFPNPAPIAATAHIDPITGADAMSFAQDVTGDLPLPAMGQGTVNFTFSPTELREYTAQVQMKGPGDCPVGIVQLKGQGANTVLSWTPQMIDYGYVSLNVTAPQDVVFTNMSGADIELTNIATNFADFAYLPPMTGGTATTLTLKGGTQTHLTVACRPASLGPRGGTLTFDTPLSMVPHGSVDLKCTGGGPEIKVTPVPTLNFGQVAFFPNSSNYSVTRKINIENIGTKPLSGDPYGNLWLGVINGGQPGNPPLVELTPDVGTDPQEFQMGLASTYPQATGLIAQVGMNMTDVVITLTPMSVGMKKATVTIHSNDPVNPTITVTVLADVEMLPPCNLAVMPMNLNFGLITPPDHKDLGVTLKNLGTNSGDTCYLSGIEIASGSDPAFSVVGGTVDMKEMQPGEVYSVVVRAWPMTAVPMTTQTLTGALHFNVASPTMPQVVVPLQAEVGPVCLTVVPDSWDFGTVQKGCNTAPQQFTVYNTCSGDVYIQGITMQQAAGEPAGGPDCPGTTDCAEFFLTSTPAIPSGGLKVPTAGTAQFSAKYHPINYGPDTGAIAISAIQSGQNVTYLVSLAGTGDMTGQQTDTFVQDQTPKADVLVVVDDSCSMADKQMELATNFASFIQYALSTNTDFQLGVTTTDAAPPVCQPPFGCVGGMINGRLCAGGPQMCGTASANNPIILTPTTPNLSTKFASYVDVGTNGGTETGFEGALQALTPPNITGENAGFLRYDANLAIVVVSDAGDQGGQPYAYYLNRFRNIKGYQRANMFTFSDIGPYNPGGPPPGNCQYDDYTDSTTYGQMVMDTNGVKAEICSTNWAANLQNLGKTAFGYRTVFFLTAEPDLTGGKMIQVAINGMAVPMGASSWTYDATTNSIDFDAMHTPGPGQTLTVTYFRQCL